MYTLYIHEHCIHVTKHDDSYCHCSWIFSITDPTVRTKEIQLGTHKKLHFVCMQMETLPVALYITREATCACLPIVVVTRKVSVEDVSVLSWEGFVPHVSHCVLVSVLVQRINNSYINLQRVLILRIHYLPFPSSWFKNRQVSKRWMI